MSTPNPTHIEILVDVLRDWYGTANIPDAEHVVSKLTDAGYSIVPTEPSTADPDETAGQYMHRTGEIPPWFSAAAEGEK